MIRAWFVNMFGRKFSKDFETIEELESCLARAREVETEFIGYVSL